MTYKIHTGDNRDILKTLPDNSIDAIVTDPPYGIDFLGKSWDINTGELETYQECLRVLKPGGHILAFSAARTYHHLAMTLERAGFEIRDQIMWIYSSGFPKSQDIGKQFDKKAGKKDPNYTGSQGKTTKGPELAFGSKVSVGTHRCGKCNEDATHQYICQEQPCGMKYTPQTEEGKQWSGWGTALKPAHEPIALARKPLKQSIAANCKEWGTGAINIDATRIPYEDGKIIRGGALLVKMDEANSEILDKTAIAENNWQGDDAGRFPSNVLGEIAEEYQKYFYCPKVSRAERHIGFDLDAIPTNPDGMSEHGGGDLHAKQANQKKNGNNHPTVKPIELMKYLIKLITPPGGTVLDPFNGSGTTGMAATELGFDYIGCELDPKYVEISIKRIEAWRNRGYNADVFDDLFTYL